MPSSLFTISSADSPLVAVALHDGHDLRDELRPLVLLDDAARRREEDPLTGDWTHCAPNRVVVHHSRFEVDLNRPRDRAVYASPEDAWGLEVWREPLPAAVISRSLAQYDLFYQMLDALLSRLVAVHGRVAVYDLHSYNHRRAGSTHPAACEVDNPEINIGTGTMNRQFWAPVVDAMIDSLGGFQFRDRALDVRENIRFRGGAMAGWIHGRYPRTVCVLAVEVKKVYMDEWTGIHDPEVAGGIGEALAGTGPAVLAALKDVRP